MEKHRLQFDLTPEALKSLDELKDQAKAATRAEVVRNALRLYAWYLTQHSQGYNVQLRKGDEVKQIELLL